jgi:hypothetical protein
MAVKGKQRDHRREWQPSQCEPPASGCLTAGG